MSHVFISYSRKDSEIVDRIVQRLEAEHFTVWIDREEIHGGDLWREAIVEAVDHAYAFVLMLSPASVASDNVRKEVDLADGAGKALLPFFLAQAQLSSRLRYQLAGIQWIEYYRDPGGKFNELVNVLRVFEKKFGMAQPLATRQVEFVFDGLDLLKLSQEERQQLQEKLLDIVASSTNTPRTELAVVTMTAGSVHIFVDMPARTAYQVKTAALNKDPELIQAGIDALRLAGDRDFVSLQTGPKTPPKSGRRGGSRGWIGGVILAIVLIISMVAAVTALTPTRNFISSFFNTVTPPPTATYTATPSNTPTDTPTNTPTDTPTNTPTDTPTSTNTPTYTPTPTDTPTLTLSTPVFTLYTGGFCRTGPGTAYPYITAVSAGETVEIIAVNSDNTWYYIHWSKYNVDCWISSITGRPAGNPSTVSVITPNIPTPSPTIIYVPTTPIPSDTKPPDVGRVSFSDTPVYYGAACASPTKLTVMAPISDPSGVKKVTLIYRYRGYPILTMPMLKFGLYFVVIDVGNQAPRYLGTANGLLDVWVQAEDALGNVGQPISGGSVAVNYFLTSPPCIPR